MELHLNITGFILIALALLHFVFPKYFQWKEELSSISLINRQLMYVHTFFIALVVLLMGLFCLFSTEDILYTRLGHHIAFGFFIFWSIRLIFQFCIYSSKLWKGKLFETTVHVLFSLLWMYLSLVFFLVYWL